jgi:hypothetical protein
MPVLSSNARASLLACACVLHIELHKKNRTHFLPAGPASPIHVGSRLMHEQYH